MYMCACFIYIHIHTYINIFGLEIFLLLYFFSLFKLLFTYSCLHFSPTTPPTQSVPPPTLDPTLLCLYPCVLYTCSLTALTPSPPIIPSYLTSDHCQSVLNFNVSGYILLACLFCCLSSSYRWDCMVFVFHHMAYFTEHNALQFHPRCLEIFLN